jgi:hypothetical protein
MSRALLTITCLISVGLPVYGEMTRDAAARLAVDVVLAKGNREVRGSIVQRREDGSLSIAVRRAWLAEQQPAWAAELDASADRERQSALEALLKRIRAWLERRADDQELAAIVRREQQGFERQLATAPADRPAEQPSEFVLIELPADQIRRAFAATEDRKQAALVAWQERLDDVESTSVDRLGKTLDDRRPDWRNLVVDLSDRLPQTAADSDPEWSARMAVYEYAFRNRLDFQGTGDFIVRTGAGDAPSGAELLSGLLQEGLGGDLAELLNGALGTDTKPVRRKTWLETASAIAEREDAIGFRVTRTQQDLTNKSVSVEDRFVARMPDGTWETIWIETVTLDASQERKELEDRIRGDQQVAEALKVAEGLGLSGEITTAVRFGAATMDAQQTADDRFFKFRDRYTQRLDGPILKWAN